MQSFGSKRKARRIGGGDEEGTAGSSSSEKGRSSPGAACSKIDLHLYSSTLTEHVDNEPVVRRPQASSKPKQRSKLRLSFGPAESSPTEDASNTSEVFTPKKTNLGRQAVERSALQRSHTPSGSAEHLPIRASQTEDRPSYSKDYLNELRNSTPSTPKELRSSSASEDDTDMAVDVSAKFGKELMVPEQSAIPSAAEIQEKKERRAKLAKEQDFISLDDDGGRELSLLPRKQKPETRLVRDDEDFAEGFDNFVEDGRISLGKKAEREQKRKHRAEMLEMIKDAEASSSEDDSEAERHRAYEAAQTRAGMDGLHHEHDGQRPSGRRTPPKITPLPRLSTCLDRLKSTLAGLQQNKLILARRMEELQQEKAEIATREVQIQELLKEAGSKYERLRAEAGLGASSKGSNGIMGGLGLEDPVRSDRGLENFGGSNDREQQNV
jgi:hypothetical protein